MLTVDPRHDYDARTLRLVVRMPTAVHKGFIAGVEDNIMSQLKKIRRGSGKAAEFAQKMMAMRSTTISLPIVGTNKCSKPEPDTSFWHVNAAYPGVVLEISYAQKRRSLSRLAEDYLLDSDASIQVMVGLDIEYRGSRKATISTWRAQEITDGEQEELRVVQSVKDEVRLRSRLFYIPKISQVFRDDDGNPSNGSGLRLRLKDFANEELAQDIGDDDHEIAISSRQLCRYLAEAEARAIAPPQEARSRHRIRPGLIKRKRSETPPEDILSGDEAGYLEQEDKAAKRAALDDADFKPSSNETSFSSL